VQITWEQMQPTLYRDLDYTYLSRLKTMIARAAQAGIKVIIDLHNYGTYNGTPITATGPVRPGHLWDVWNRLAYHFAGDQRVYAYDLMNEPHDLDPAMWEACTNHVAEGIRQRGDDHLISVSGLGWSAMHAFAQFHPGGPWMTDPNVVYTAHAYWHLESGSNLDYDTEVAASKAQGY
jgi:aryl-phospho-beta-D-glucosidase BglC (GH1 family)